MIKDLLRYGLAASTTALICCVGPSILFAIGLSSGIFAFQFADFFYNADGSANVYAWILRVIGALIVTWGIMKYSRKENCTLNSPKQKMFNKVMFAVILISLAYGLFELFTYLTTEYFEIIDVTRQQEYKS